MLKNLWQTRITDTATKDLEGVGRLRTEADGKMYRWVQLGEADGTDMTVGQVLFHKLSETTDMFKKGYQCLTANLSVMGGVIMATTLEGGSSLTDATNLNKGFGWIQVKGECASVSVSGATTGGTALAAGDYLKGVTGVAHVVRDAASPATYIRNIQILEAVATTTTPAPGFKAGLVNCL